MNSAWPSPNYLNQVVKLCESNGTVCVFDETITGFRFSRAGAQGLFNVQPHLSTFGKGIANGYPLSVIGGKREIMREMERVFFSGTFGGEVAFSQISRKCKMEDFLSTSGHPSWKFLNWHGNSIISTSELKTFFLQEVLQRGVLVLSTHNICLRHTRKMIDATLGVYDEVLEKMSALIADGDLKKALRVEPIKPLFSIRR